MCGDAALTQLARSAKGMDACVVLACGSFLSGRRCFSPSVAVGEGKKQETVQPGGEKKTWRMRSSRTQTMLCRWRSQMAARAPRSRTSVFFGWGAAGLCCFEKPSSTWISCRRRKHASELNGAVCRSGGTAGETKNPATVRKSGHTQGLFSQSVCEGCWLPGRDGVLFQAISARRRRRCSQREKRRVTSRGETARCVLRLCSPLRGKFTDRQVLEANGTGRQTPTEHVTTTIWRLRVQMATNLIVWLNPANAKVVFCDGPTRRNRAALNEDSLTRLLRL